MILGVEAMALGLRAVRQLADVILKEAPANRLRHGVGSANAGTFQAHKEMTAVTAKLRVAAAVRNRIIPGEVALHRGIVRHGIHPAMRMRGPGVVIALMAVLTRLRAAIVRWMDVAGRSRGDRAVLDGTGHVTPPERQLPADGQRHHRSGRRLGDTTRE